MAVREVFTPQSICRFGLATGPITPPVGIYHRMWGAARHDRATGVHRPLQAAAMVFRPIDTDDDASQTLVTIDHCLLWARDMQALLETVSQRAGVAAERLVITFSHTHGAGLMDRRRRDLPGGELIAEYLDALAERLAELVRRAGDAVQEATIGYAAGRCALAAHRDYWDEAAQQFVCGWNPGGDADDTVLVARVTDPAGRLRATIVNYACHPTTLAWQNTLISPDYVGALRELVEQTTGAPCVFLQGACGDLGPRAGFVGAVALADRNGRQLGHAALSALEALPPPATVQRYGGAVVSGATIGVWNDLPLSQEQRQRSAWFLRRRFEVPLEYRPGLPSREQTVAEQRRWQQAESQARESGAEPEAAHARAMVERATRQLARLEGLPAGSTFPLPVTCWRLGDAVWLAAEGELYQYFQRELRRRFDPTPIVVIELANGSRYGYLPTRQTYGTGIYQELVAVLAPGSLERLVDAIAQELEQLRYGVG